MEFTRVFGKLSKGDADIAGGKGASLGEMTQAGIPVPPGFVILSSAFDAFLSRTGLDAEIDALLETVNHKSMSTVEHASETIQALILHKEMPADIAKDILKAHKTLDSKYVAVRSSATAEDGASAAWAGQLESYLNTTDKDLLENVRHCWASLFSPRAIFYRFEKKQHGQHISVAVVVQQMIESEVSGIAFSVHPVTQDSNQMIIESGYGLGEAIVSGSITPDNFVVRKDNWSIFEQTIGTQEKGIFRKKGGGNEWKKIPSALGSLPSLSNEEVLTLAKTILHIEKHYGFPVDVEWAKVKNQFYIVQSRPITTLKKEGAQKMKDSAGTSDLNVIDGVQLSLVITRNMSYWHECLSTLGHYHNTKDFGIITHFLIPFITINGTQTHVFTDMPSFKAYQDELFRVLDTKEKIAALKEKYMRFGNQFLESLTLCKKEPTLPHWEAFEKQYMRYCAGLFPTAALGRRGGELLTERLKEIGIQDADISSTIATITYPTEHTPLFDSQMDLLAIAVQVQESKISKKQKEDELAIWLGKYGSIPVNFCDEPWTMEDAHAQLGNMLLKECKKEFKALEVSHDERVGRAQKRIEEIGDARISLLAHLMQEATLMNEFRKNVFCRVSLGYRSIFEQVAKQCGLSHWRDCFYLHPDEVRSVIAGKKLFFKNIAKERELMGATMANDTLVSLDAKTLEKLEKYVHLQLGKGKSSEVTGTTMEGFSANSGIVRGVAKIILHSQDFKKLLPGEILVTTMTSVDFVPVMERAAAFVTNEGGITSHASIVAREMNKPCVIGTKVATQMIRDGDMIEVDGDRGIVTILK